MLRPRCVLYLIDLSPGMSSIFSRSTSGPGILKLLFPEHSLTTQKSQPSKTIPRTGVEHTNSPRIIDAFSNFFANPYTASRSLNDDSLYFVFWQEPESSPLGDEELDAFMGVDSQPIFEDATTPAPTALDTPTTGDPTTFDTLPVDLPEMIPMPAPPSRNSELDALDARILALQSLGCRICAWTGVCVGPEPHQ